MRNSVIFLINLLQDFNIVRPLAALAARQLDVRVEFMLSYRFLQRDTRREWQREIALTCGAIGADVHVYANEYDAMLLLAGKCGVLVAASESSLGAHADTHNVFRVAPPEFLKVTLQHGFECVGFLQNREHDRAHGTSVRFAADVLCGWFDSKFMTSMAASERPKLYVTGPSSVLQQPKPQPHKPHGGGLVCENLHSVRLSASGDFKTGFMDIFFAFCKKKAKKAETVFLRPHPGGQYVIKNNIALPDNVKLNNGPAYKVDFAGFDYGISAPSSILIDMVLAKLPVAVWGDEDGVMDMSNYDGLMSISTLADWMLFSNAAIRQRDEFVQKQQNFLDRINMPVAMEEVRGRYLRLFAAGTAHVRQPIVVQDAAEPAAMLEDQSVPAEAIVARSGPVQRVLFIANANIPTYQLSFVKPLKPLVESGALVTELLSEDYLASLPKGKRLDAAIAQFKAFQPTLVVFCRYSGPFYDTLLDMAREANCPVVYHVDDDLLNIPVEIGVNKHAFHNRSDRLSSVSFLLDNADLIYSSTIPLKRRYENYGFRTPIIAGNVYCSGSILGPAPAVARFKVGYMGFDHAHDLEMVLPPLVQYLRGNPHVQFELFGSIPVPHELEEFGDRVTVIEPIRDYQAFLKRFSELGWNIGICPLQNTAFNRVKANTKWVEYTSIGAAVIASRGMMYNGCCADNCGLLAETDEQWFRALTRLTHNHNARLSAVTNAQERLRNEYSEAQLRNQILDIFEQARTLHAAKYNAPAKSPRERIVVITDAVAATQEISFRHPLLPLDRSGDITLSIVEDNEALHLPHKFEIFWARVRPTVVFFSRFAAASQTLAFERARAEGTPIIFHLDDNLFRVPDELGSDKVSQHNDPEHLKRLRQSVDTSDLVYASTQGLRDALTQENLIPPIYAGDIYCAVDAARLASYAPNPTPVIGYMGTGSHINDLQLILPALDRLMEEFPDLRFEAFGSISAVADFSRYGDRYLAIRRTDSYEQFVEKLATLGWWAGLAPLEDHAFNRCKADTKWVEYSASGIPVIASDISVYKRACGEGSGLMARNSDDWYHEMRRTLVDANLRAALVEAAQEKLLRVYRMNHLTDQIFDVIATVRATVGSQLENA